MAGIIEYLVCEISLSCVLTICEPFSMCNILKFLKA